MGFTAYYVLAVLLVPALTLAVCLLGERLKH